MGPHPAVAAIRLAVRRELMDVGDHPVLVACSGGADSLALLAATVFEARRETDYHRQVVGVTVDHGLQVGSAERADQVAAQMAALGAAETMSVRVTVDAPGMGVEAAARQARYAALEEAAERLGSGVVLLGHTLDDQAETVLLGLTRGSGGRSLAGMRRGFDRFRRPLLDITRAQTEAACRAEGIEFWSDPHNEDPRFTRSRVRHTVLPMLEKELGPGVAANLAKTADLLREDMSALDSIAEWTLREITEDEGLYTPQLETLSGAVQTRVIRLAALEAGVIASEFFRVHIDALAELAAGVDEGKQVQLPGRVTAYRDGNHLKFRPTVVAG